MSFSERLEALLYKKNVSGYQLAKATGLAQSQISNWKKGDKLPSFENIVTLSKYLEVSTDYLLLGKTQESSMPKLTEGEEELLKLLHPLSPNEQQRVIGVVQNYLGIPPKPLIELPQNLPSVSDGIRELQAEQLAEAFKNSTKPVK